MSDLSDGETTQVKGSGSATYTLKNTGGMYSCTCPAWMHQSIPVERRTCKHLRALRGDDAERERLGTAELAGKPVRAARPKSADGQGEEPAEGEEPPLLLAHKWEMDVDLAGWWMSEKLDGVRAYWDGKQFLSRLGNRFHAPDWFIAGLPGTPLDGELWGGRKKFQRTVGLVKRQDKSDHWKELQYVVFDAPAHQGTFEERIEHCREVLDVAKNQYASLLAHEPCRGEEHLKEELARVEGLGGEGLMLRKPKSNYEVGRSSTLLKVKSFHDAEAKVVGHAPGAGRHKGRLGALIVEMPDGTQFNVGTGYSDAERENPPPIGAIITYRYQELSEGGVPRFPSYVGVRDDVRWTSKGKAAGRMSARAAALASASAPASASASASGARYFEFVEGTSSKFWEILLEGASFTTRYGKIGTDGQSATKSFANEDKAKAEHDKLVIEKTKKGYREVSAP
ncbi:DNA ligase (ATP) [Labilithrix luteola]|uniref:DNA ligase (ATP) n=1 Tax=Labilithrix luteola TaxID=1391654 RepID=A0A0K1PM03_9BACT|nr:DNA ligase [Labilithrix luteola]AKU94568.1 DNA ligase (ATP) [Labilithrix luteola]